MSETIVSAMLKKTALFGDLTLAERLALASTMRRGDVPKDAHVFHAGDPGRSFFLIVAGRIKISLSRQGREIVLAELGPGDYFGEFSLIDGRPRSARTIAPSPDVPRATVTIAVHSKWPVLSETVQRMYEAAVLELVLAPPTPQ